MWSDGADLDQISRWCQPEKSKRDHLASRSFRRRVRAVSRKSVRSSRPASAHAEARKIDPAVLLNMRLSPTMYSLKQQVGEANRHATVAGALLAGRAPHTFSDTEPDIAELKARISAAIDFVQGLPRAEIDAAADKEVAFTFKNGAPAKIHRQIAAADVQRSAVLLSRHDGLRHPAPRRRRYRQEGFSGAAEIKGKHAYCSGIFQIFRSDYSGDFGAGRLAHLRPSGIVAARLRLCGKNCLLERIHRKTRRRRGDTNRRTDCGTSRRQTYENRHRHSQPACRGRASACSARVTPHMPRGAVARWFQNTKWRSAPLRRCCYLWRRLTCCGRRARRRNCRMIVVCGRR